MYDLTQFCWFQLYLNHHNPLKFMSIYHIQKPELLIFSFFLLYSLAVLQLQSTCDFPNTEINFCLAYSQYLFPWEYTGIGMDPIKQKGFPPAAVPNDPGTLLLKRKICRNFLVDPTQYLCTSFSMYTYSKTTEGFIHYFPTQRLFPGRKNYTCQVALQIKQTTGKVNSILP